MSKQSYKNRWSILGDLGEGGQGRVYRVLDNDKVNLDSLNPKLGIGIRQASQDLRGDATHGDELRKLILQIIDAESYKNQGALKVLHEATAARDDDEKRAELRIRDEIKVMTETTHTNLLRILDSNSREKWYVSEYHPLGTLDKHLNEFRGKVFDSIAAIRPVVEAVAVLHNKNIVHRDIKPHNIFLSEDQHLILGDFGLVFLMDEDRTRISPTFDNVGSRDWMPGWAQSIRIENIKPSFDVYSLGKVLWSMISGIIKLQFWYFDRPNNNLERKFPGDNYIRLVNSLLGKCVVENEEDCMKDASAMLEEIDKILNVLRVDADILDINVKRKCRVCGLGEYVIIVQNDEHLLGDIGLSPTPGHGYYVFECNNCGHVQLFHFKGDKLPPGWL